MEYVNLYKPNVVISAFADFLHVNLVLDIYNTIMQPIVLVTIHMPHWCTIKI